MTAQLAYISSPSNFSKNLGSSMMRAVLNLRYFSLVYLYNQLGYHITVIMMDLPEIKAHIYMKKLYGLSDGVHLQPIIIMAFYDVTYNIC